MTSSTDGRLNFMSRRRPIKAVVTALLATVALSVSLASPAAADSASDLDALVALNPGIQKTTLQKSIEDAAASSGESYDKVLSAALTEARSSKDRAASARKSSSQKYTPQASSGGGARSISLGSSQNKGDVFVAPSDTLGYDHGHTGIYYTTSTIVEAPGTCCNSRAISAASVKVGGGTTKERVGVTQTSRNASANYAYNNYQGQGYNYNFAFNRTANYGKMNCSQLVWASYIRGSNIDIDGNGGNGVYPYDIRDSGYTTTYATL